MNTTVVITSIFPPTEAVKSFADMEHCKLIVVGDKKTPADWSCRGATYMAVEDALQSDSKLGKLIPFNHYARKMLGYVAAIHQGAAVIVDTDDDNIPKDGWAFPTFDGEFETVQSDLGHVNVYQLYSDQPIWPRGLPLRLITTDFDLESKLHREAKKIGVWQGLADEDPDVDAIYRLTLDTPCVFKSRPAPIVLGTGTLSPFNSQNTAIRVEMFPLLYLPAYVTFRFTDILRGLVAQPIMWAAGFCLGFTNATVKQIRNPHDYMKDFESEIPMYRFTEKVTEIAVARTKRDCSIADNLLNVYEALEIAGIVEAKELRLLDAWLASL